MLIENQCWVLGVTLDLAPNPVYDARDERSWLLWVSSRQLKSNELVKNLLVAYYFVWLFRVRLVVQYS
jgi:hypothetical protein